MEGVSGGRTEGAAGATGRRGTGKERETQAGARWALELGAPVQPTPADQVGRCAWGCNVRAGRRQAWGAHRQRVLGFGGLSPEPITVPWCVSQIPATCCPPPGPLCHQTGRTWRLGRVGWLGSGDPAREEPGLCGRVRKGLGPALPEGSRQPPCCPLEPQEQRPVLKDTALRGLGPCWQERWPAEPLQGWE